MPAHYTQAELELIEKRRKNRNSGFKQLSLFGDEEQMESHTMKEWICESYGHRWRCRSWGTHAECIPID